MKKLFFPLVLFLMIFSAFAPAEEKRYNVPIGDSPSLGPAQAAVTIIEFIDFQ